MTYETLFARVYNARWVDFARTAAPAIREVYESTPLGASERTLLDVACGTGQLATYFLEAGYTVTGLDLSPAMLDHARQNAGGRGTFILGDAADFSIPEPVGLAVSTYDALNHLPDLAALRGCLQSVSAALRTGGTFIFDLNTRHGLSRWSGVQVMESEDMTIITRGVYDGGDRAFTQISGYVRAEDGRYDRFNEVIANTVFDMVDVRAALSDAGFSTAYPAVLRALAEPIEDPEAVGRVFWVARRA